MCHCIKKLNEKTCLQLLEKVTLWFTCWSPFSVHILVHLLAHRGIVLVHPGKILVHPRKSVLDKYWSIPGGRPPIWISLLPVSQNRSKKPYQALPSLPAILHASIDLPRAAKVRKDDAGGITGLVCWGMRMLVVSVADFTRAQRALLAQAKTRKR